MRTVTAKDTVRDGGALHGARSRSTLFLATLLGSWCLPVIAQVQVPPGATPGGALPRVEPAVQPPEKQRQLFDIPRMYDRPLGLEEGPRIVVKAFKLRGAVDRPKHHLKVAEAQAVLDAARDAQPAKGFSINQLQEVANKVAAYYDAHGYILAQAFIPAQKVTDGVVTVQVLEGKLAGVRVEGNKRYPTRTLERPFKSLIGAPVDKDTIESALLTLTNYPGLTAFGVLGAGTEVGTTNLTLRVQSEERFRVEAVLDNYGTQFAGQYRVQATVTINDPLHFGDRLRLTGLYATGASGGSSHGAYGGADYEIPLFSPNDSLHLVHLTNQYNVGEAAAAVTTARSDGKTRVDEVGYRHDFARTRLGSASLGFAFNVKSATFNSPPSVIYDDKLATARIDGQWERVDTRFRGVETVLLSYTHGFNNILGALGAYNPADAANSHTSRLGASGEFNKVNLEIQRLQRLTRYTSLVLRVNGQYTPDPLVSLEQFSLGGPDSVRAYPVSYALAEKGGIGTLEYVVGAPGFASRQGPGNRAWGDILQFSLFADYANGELNAPLTSAQTHDVGLSGGGGAIQFSLPGRLFARLDVSTTFNNRTPQGGHHPQCYFRLGTSF